MNDIAAAREKYRPRVVRFLFVAESPPPDPKPGEPRRFFYFEDVPDKDTLYLEMMKALYSHGLDTFTMRTRKQIFLERFRADGYFLMDALDEPIGVKEPGAKLRKIVAHRDTFMQRLSSVATAMTPIVLISRPVYDALFDHLIEQGYNVINTEMVDFPGSGRQVVFREKMAHLLNRLG